MFDYKSFINDIRAEMPSFDDIAEPNLVYNEAALNLSLRDVLKVTDLTLLKADAGRNDILALCHKAVEVGAKTVCVNSSWVNLAARALDASGIKAISVVGFPLGASHPKAVVAEAVIAVNEGAAEIDMVMPVGWLKAKQYGHALENIRLVVAAAKVPVKVIMETCLLTDDEIVRGCLVAAYADAAFVKTSTGFGSAGATEHHVSLMRATVGSSIGVKASGGVRTLTQARAMIRAGASRIGASMITDDQTAATGSY